MTLEDRVLALEASCARWRRIATGLLLLAAMGGTLAAVLPQEVPNEIRAKKILVVDDRGRTTIALGTDHLGGILTVHDKRGPVVAAIRSDPKGYGRIWVTHQGAPFVIISASGEGHGTMAVLAKGHRKVVELGEMLEGQGYMRINRCNGAKVQPWFVASPAKQQDERQVTLYDKEGRRVAALGTATDGSGQVSVWAEAGKRRSVWPEGK